MGGFQGKAWGSYGRRGKRDPGSDLAERRTLWLKIRNWWLKTRWLMFETLTPPRWLFSSPALSKHYLTESYWGENRVGSAFPVLQSACRGSWWVKSSFSSSCNGSKASHLVLSREIQVWFVEKTLLKTVVKVLSTMCYGCVFISWNPENQNIFLCDTHTIIPDA